MLIILDIDKIKQSLTTKDISNILVQLGSSYPKTDGSDNLIFQTVCHGGEKYKLYYYPDSYSFHCYTDCSCNYTVFTLIQKVKSCSFIESINFISRVTGVSYFGYTTFNKIQESYLIDDWKWIEKLKVQSKQEIQLPIFNRSVLDVFSDLPHQLWIDEGISAETMRQFDIGYYIKEDRITIPHFNIDGELVGIRGRAMRQEDLDAGSKYMPLIVNQTKYYHPLGFNLYGLNHTKQAIRRIKKVMIFEGEKSVLKCQDYYGDDNFSVACCGMNLSTWQRDTIVDLGVEEVFIGFDKQYNDVNSDEAYRHAEKVLKIAHKFTPYCTTYAIWDDRNLLGYKDSPADCGKDTLEQLMKLKYEVKTKNFEGDNE